MPPFPAVIRCQSAKIGLLNQIPSLRPFPNDLLDHQSGERNMQPPSPTQPTHAASTGLEAIAVLHGFGGHRWLMYPLARRLRTRGFQVHNWGYRSILSDLESHAARFTKLLDSIEADASISKFHIVAHSMGSIVTRVVLRKFQPSKLSRIVMLCPPNRGSHIATRYAPAFGWLSTTLEEIKDTPDSFVNKLSPQIDPRYELGIIQAGTDFVVAQDATQLDSAKEYRMVAGLHSSVIFRKQTATLVESFLRTGSFA